MHDGELETVVCGVQEEDRAFPHGVDEWPRGYRQYACCETCAKKAKKKNIPTTPSPRENVPKKALYLSTAKTALRAKKKTKEKIEIKIGFRLKIFSLITVSSQNATTED